MVAGGRGGRIVNVTSAHEHVPWKARRLLRGQGGLGLLTTVMARGQADPGILVNSVAAGQISTPMARPGGWSSKPSSGPLPRDRRRHRPLGRPGSGDTTGA